LNRYGELFRGNKVQEAEKRGVAAVIIYSDPIDYGAPDLNVSNTFPNSVFMPPGGAQRGSLLETNGDPLTPLYPSKSYAYRININDVLNGVTAPTIPVMPIGYRDAIKLFQNMNGQPVPTDWIGGMVSYMAASAFLFKGGRAILLTTLFTIKRQI
jgi:N-acetylated-alpha-linked acidic dipeptidase